MNVMRRWFRQYWPFLAIPPVAALVHGVLVMVGDPWSAAEWASNIVFAYIVAIAAVVLSQRQAQLQQASADSQLLEKVAAVTGALDRFRTYCHASTAQQILIDARAGLHLLPYADDDARREYLEAISDGVALIGGTLSDSVRPYSRWTPAQRQVLADAARSLLVATESLVTKAEDKQSSAVRLIQETLPRLATVPVETNIVPLGAFERSFRWGDVGQRVRTLLDWDLLHEFDDTSQLTITVHDHYSLDWLNRHEIFAVWYMTKDDQFAEYFEENVRPVKLNDVGGVLGSLSQANRANIESMARWLERLIDGQLPTTEVVTLQLTPSRLLVLDGNHRVAAIQHGSQTRPGPLPVTIIEHRIQAPLDHRLLPDLEVHTQGSSTSKTDGGN